MSPKNNSKGDCFSLLGLERISLILRSYSRVNRVMIVCVRETQMFYTFWPREMANFLRNCLVANLKAYFCEWFFLPYIISLWNFKSPKLRMLRMKTLTKNTRAFPNGTSSSSRTPVPFNFLYVGYHCVLMNSLHPPQYDS